MSANPERSKKDAQREMLRHAVATIAYRGGKALRGVPENFSRFEAGNGARTPGKILAHICDLFDWALSISQGQEEWHNSKPQSWDEDVTRFHSALSKFDEVLASDVKLPVYVESLFQGPIADALTHIGQISILRRIAGGPVRAENYVIAEVVAGRVGAEQAAPKYEFD
jgi:hypothetical protein